jgi:hypothetical protein
VTAVHLADAPGQVDMACKALAADPNLAGGFNVIGVSQVQRPFASHFERSRFTWVVGQDQSVISTKLWARVCG